MQIEVWSDVVCPWCYIGKRRLETALARFPRRDRVEVVWRSFPLDPGIPEGETHPTLPALAAKYGRGEEEMRAMMTSVEQLAADEGTGVPFFVVDRRYGAAGAQPAEVLLSVLERAW